MSDTPWPETMNSVRMDQQQLLAVFDFHDGAASADCGTARLPLAHGALSLRSGRRTALAASYSAPVTLILHGEVYFKQQQARDAQARQLLDHYLASEPAAFAEMLNGSFVVLIVDRRSDDLLVITDRLGFCKAFVRQEANRAYIATTPSAMPNQKLDPVGALTYLTNSFIFSGRTVFENVRSLERASLHSIGETGVRSVRYWEYDFPGAEDQADYAACFAAYAEMMRRAVKRRVPPGNGRIFISLSSGIDSRAVLGCLLDVVADRSRIVAFSYGAPQDEDVTLARRVAEQAGIRHVIVQFGGSLASTISRNASLGEGMVCFYTHGIDGLMQMSAQFGEHDVLFVGDLAVQRGERQFNNLDDVLNMGMEIRSPIRVPDYYSLGEFDAEHLRQQVENEIKELKNRCEHFCDLQDVHDFLFLDQRTSNMLLPWREFLAGRFITVCDPFLDNELLDFYRTHARAFRKDKSLHRYATERMFPDLCALGFGKSGVENSFVNDRFVPEQDALEAMAREGVSLLDTLLPPALVAAVVTDACQRMKVSQSAWPTFIHTGMKKIRRRLLRQELSTVLGKDAVLPELGIEQIERMLTLRQYCRQEQQHGD